jgi:hypothetical protein
LRNLADEELPIFILVTVILGHVTSDEFIMKRSESLPADTPSLFPEESLG